MNMNMKGGVGKTTLTVHLAWALAWHYDKRILVVDYDPQCSASLAFLEASVYYSARDSGRTLSGLLTPSVKPQTPFVHLSVRPKQSPPDLAKYTTTVRNWHYTHNQAPAGGIDLIPGNLDLIRIAVSNLTKEAEQALFQRWSALLDEARKSYDLVVVDLHPAGSFFTKSSALTADLAVVPVTSDQYAALGLGLMRQFLLSWKAEGGTDRYVVVFNEAAKGWDSSVERAIRTNPRYTAHCLSTRLQHSSLISRTAASKTFPLEHKGPYHKVVSGNVRGLADELVGRMSSLRLINSGDWRRYR